MSKKNDTWMPLYIGDYLADTSRLSTEQHGAYLLILMDYWRNGPPLDDDEELASITKLSLPQWRKHSTKLRAMFQAQDGRLTQKRADAERQKAGLISSKRSEAGKAGAAAKWGKQDGKPIANAMANGMANVQQNDGPSQSPIPNTENTGRAATSTVVARASEPETEGHTPTSAGLICRAMKSQGLAAVNPGDPRLLALIAQGATVAEFEGLTAEAVEKRKGFAWVLAVLAARRADVAELRLAPSAEEATPWHEGGRKAIEGKAATLGIGPWDEVQEQWHQYRARVFKAAGFTPERSAA